jgi:hypothetical protein
MKTMGFFTVFHLFLRVNGTVPIPINFCKAEIGAAQVDLSGNKAMDLGCTANPYNQ